MQTSNFTNQLTAANGGGSAANALTDLVTRNANAARNGTSFGAETPSFSSTLSREMAQRQAGAGNANNNGNAGINAAPAPQTAAKPQPQAKPAEKAPEAKPADGNQPANADQANDTTATSASADKAADSDKPAADSASAAGAKAGKDADDSADGQQVADAAAAVTPVTDMLALMASLAGQPTPAAPQTTAAAASAAADALGGIGKGGKGGAVSTDPAALQAIKDMTDDAAATGFATTLTKTVAQLGDKAQAQAALAGDAKAIALPQDAAIKGKDLKAETTATAAADTAAAQDGATTTAAATDKPLATAARADVKATPDASQAAQSKPQAEYATERLHIQTAAQTNAHEPQVVLPAAAAQIQAANGLEAAQAAGAAAGDRIHARVGTPAWENQVGQKIVWMAAGGDQSAELTLNPPDLGPMQVVLSVNNDQATVSFTSAQPEVRQALETAMPKLKEMMSESGISLGSATVNAGNPGQQGDQQRMAGHANGNGNGQGGRYGNDSGSNGNVNEVQPQAQRTVQRLDRGMVDTFA